MRAIAALLLISSTAVARPRPPDPEPVVTEEMSTEKPLPNDRQRIVGILDVRVEGVPKEIADKFQASLEEQLDSNKYWIAPQARVHEMMESSTKFTEGCLLGPCLREVKAQTRADLVLLAALTGSGTSFGYVVSLVRTDTGRLLAQQAERCDVCTVNEALTNATAAAVKLLISAPEKLPDEAGERQHAIDAAVASEREHRTSMHKHHRNTAVVMTLAGIAVAAIGATLYYTQDHADYGLATAAGGAGLAVGGVIALTF